MCYNSVLPSPSLSSYYVLQSVTTVTMGRNVLLQCVALSQFEQWAVWAVLPYAALSQFEQ